MHVPKLTTSEGMFHWIMLFIILTAALAATILLLSWLGWLPPIDRLDTGGAVLAIA